MSNSRFDDPVFFSFKELTHKVSSDSKNSSCLLKICQVFTVLDTLEVLIFVHTIRLHCQELIMYILKLKLKEIYFVDKI